MPSFFLVSALILCAVLPLFIYRIIYGPSIFDRLIGLNGIATKSILLLSLFGAATGQLDMFIDIALGYGLLNLVGAIAVGKFVEKKGHAE